MVGNWIVKWWVSHCVIREIFELLCASVCSMNRRLRHFWDSFSAAPNGSDLQILIIRHMFSFAASFMTFIHHVVGNNEDCVLKRNGGTKGHLLRLLIVVQLLVLIYFSSHFNNISVKIVLNYVEKISLNNNVTT